MIMVGCTPPAEGQSNKDKGARLLAAADKNDVTLIKQLIGEKANLEVRDNKDRTPLMIVTYSDNLEAARILIEASADVNAQDDILNSPFLYAGASGYLEIVKLCLSHNANFKIYNRYGGTALIPAAEKGHVAVVQELANTKGFPIDHINKLGWTALLEAIVLSNGGLTHQRIVQVLIDAGCNVNIADSDGVTPLQHARKRGYAQITSMLEKAGAK